MTEYALLCCNILVYIERKADAFHKDKRNLGNYFAENKMEEIMKRVNTLTRMALIVMAFSMAVVFFSQLPAATVLASKVQSADEVEIINVTEDVTTGIEFNAEKEGYATGLTPEEVEEEAEVASNVPQMKKAKMRASLPETVDNTQPMGENNRTYFPEIGNQASIGSCWAWSEVYYQLTYAMNRYYDREVAEDNIMSPKYNYYRTFVLMGGGSCDSIGALSIKDVPLVHFSTESDMRNYPIDIKATEEMQLKALENKMEFENVPRDVETIKGLLADGEVLRYSSSSGWIIKVVPDGYSHAGEKIIASEIKTSTGHAMTIVGYDDNVACDLDGDGCISTDEKGAFKVANSWGKSWCNSGFVWVSYNAFEEESNVKLTSSQTRVLPSAKRGVYNGPYEPDYYEVVTLETSDVNTASVTTMLVVGGNHSYYLPISVNADDLKITNYSGTTGKKEATFVWDMECYEVFEDLSERDMEDILATDTWYVDCIYSGDTTLKDVHYVNNKKGETYAAKYKKTIDPFSGNDEIKATLNTATIVPTVKILNVVYDENSKQYKISADATDDKGNLKYRFYSQDKDGNVTELKGYSKNKEIVCSLSAAKTFQICVDVKDSDGNVTTKKMEYLVEAQKSVVYYQNTSWNQAYIHYKVGNGEWTTVPGVKMETANDQEGYQWKYVIDLDETEEATVCFNNGSGNWDSRNGSNYSVGVGTYGIKNGSVSKLTALPTITAAPTATVTPTPTVAPTATVTPTVLVTPTATPVFKITSIDPSVPSPQKTGSTIILDATVENIGYLYPNGGYTYDFTITKDGVETARLVSFAGSGSVAEWTPTEPGTYVITVTTVSKYSVATATASMEYVIQSEDNISTVYYSNASWNQAYIHFKTNDGSWTAVPGIKMEDNKSENGYTWKYVIDLGKADGATVCFNNGNNSWDSRNGANYSVGIGSYGIKNGEQEKLPEGISLNVSADREVGGTNVKTVFTAQAEDGTAPYTYQFAVVNAGQTPSEQSYVTVAGNTYEYTPYTAREYTVYVKVTDAAGKTAGTSMDYTVEGHKWGDFTATANDHKVGTMVKLKAEYINYRADSYNRYSFVIQKDGIKNEYSTGSIGYLEWTPQEEGTYTITARFHSYEGPVYETSMEYTVSNGNIVTVYYNSNWDNAYIHYCVAGKSWTAVPGVIMEKSTERVGYNYKYVIDLGEASTVQVCFNNGNGSWDSRNGANYTVNTGTCGISNGNIVNLQ